MNNLLEHISRLGVIPVIAIDNVKDALPLADALLEGGLPVAEITFRTPAASEVIQQLAEKRPELIVGAGTILDSATLGACISSGARFGLAPGFDLAIQQAAQVAEFPFFPGVITPSDISVAARHGARIVKFFPASAAGGPSALTSIAAPFHHLGMRFIPTGGVKVSTIADWLRLSQVICVGGTWIATSKDIREGAFREITRNAREAVAAVARSREMTA